MFFFHHLGITLIPMTTWSSRVDKSNMAAEKSCPLKHLKLNKCFIHFDDVSQSLTKITEAHLKKFVACRPRWAELEGQKYDICLQPTSCLATKMWTGIFRGQFAVENVILTGITIKIAIKDSVTKINCKKQRKSIYQKVERKLQRLF